MQIPKFLIADNSEFKNVFFVIHTEYPRFLLNVVNDKIYWMEEFDEENQSQLESETIDLIGKAYTFFDREM